MIPDMEDLKEKLEIAGHKYATTFNRLNEAETALLAVQDVARRFAGTEKPLAKEILRITDRYVRGH